MWHNFGLPQAKQDEFLRATAPYVAFGGARGGGKSWAIRFKACVLALAHPGIRMLLLRRTFPELDGNHIKPLIRDTHGIATYRDSDKTLTFCTGSVLKFGYCDSENDVMQYQGQEYDVIFMDEATNFTEYQYDCIRACNRGANDMPKHMFLTCNPGGVGHGWVKRLFVDRDYKDGEKAENYQFIQSKVYDNKILMEKDPEYIQKLKTLSPELQKAWLEGDWDVFAGQFFSEFRRDRHVITPCDIPDWWTRVIAIDYGLDMLAAVWGAFDDKGHCYIYKEMCRPQLAVPDAAAAIIGCCTDGEYTYTANGGKRVTVVAPPDLWGRTVDSGVSIAEQFARNGVSFVRGDNNRQNGWLNVKAWLLSANDDECPKMQIFENCTELIKCLPLLQYSKRNSMDCATEPHDITHAPDALRYLLQSRPRAGKAPDTRTDAEARADELAAYKQSRFSNGADKKKVIRRY